MEFKNFILEITGKYCNVPHPDRKIFIYNGLENEEVTAEDTLTNTETMLVIHEVSCNLKKKLHDVMNKKDLKALGDRFEKYYFGEVTEKSVLKDFSIVIRGRYNDIANSGRIVIVDDKDNKLSSGETSMVLYDIVCNLRNLLSQTMSRDEMADLAEKHKIFNFGMMRNEEPFVVD